jgi:osmotically-inducible protein OsmY
LTPAAAPPAFKERSEHTMRNPDREYEPRGRDWRESQEGRGRQQSGRTREVRGMNEGQGGYDLDEERRAGGYDRPTASRFEDRGEHDWRSQGTYDARGEWGGYGQQSDFGPRGDEWQRRGFSRTAYGSPGGYESQRGPRMAEGSRSWYADRGSMGRGPKGYQRSDERIREDVCDRLGQTMDASEVEVDVKQGVVTFKGSVNERRDKRRAEDLVEGIPGVKDVNNQIRVSGSNGAGERESESAQGRSGTSERQGKNNR